MDYFSKIKKLVTVKEGSKITITGATGSLGKQIVTFFSNYPIKLLLIGRNKKKLRDLKDSLKNSKAEITFFPLDLSDIKSVKESISFLQKEKIDIFYNNAGVFRQNIQRDRLDSSFLIDYLVPVYFMKQLSISNPKMIFINTASISYHYHRYTNEIEGLNIKSKIQRYGFLKRLLMMETLFLQEKGIRAYLAHPGISYTGLFSKENQAYPNWFLSLIKYPMKLIFMNPKKASLSLILASSLFPKNPSYYLGPKGFFHGWGYPKFQKLSKRLLDKEKQRELDAFTEKYLMEYFS